MTYRILFAFLFIYPVLLFSGCGGEQLPPGMPQLYRATLTVIQDGKPLAGATVVLINTDPSTSWSAGGMTDGSGVVKLRTMGRYDGVPVGTYKVGVRKIDAPDITLPDEPPTDSEERREYNRLVKEIEDNSFYVVDEKFSLGKTELEVEITPSNLNVTVDVSPAVQVKVPVSPRG